MKNKNFLFTLACFVILAGVPSCSKPTIPAPPPPLTTTLKFVGNGTLVQWNGSSPLGTSTEGSIIQKYSVSYTLFSHPAGGGIYSPGLYLNMFTTNLVAGTYTRTIPVTIDWNLAEHTCIMPGGLYYVTSEAGDFVTVNITSIHDGNYADGTFSAQMTNTPNGSLNKLNITNGEFRNIRIDL